MLDPCYLYSTIFKVAVDGTRVMRYGDNVSDHFLVFLLITRFSRICLF